MTREAKLTVLVFVSIALFFLTFCLIVRARSAPSVPADEIVEGQTSNYPW